MMNDSTGIELSPEVAVANTHYNTAYAQIIGDALKRLSILTNDFATRSAISNLYAFKAPPKLAFPRVTH
jgi:hypothetical protein